MIQDRIIQYLDYKGISKYKFYKDTGLSNGFLDKKGSIGVDKCEIIISLYNEINLYWLVLGQGEMLKGEPAVESKKGGESSSEAISIMLRQVQELSVENHELKREIEALRAEKKIKKSVSYGIAAESVPELSKKKAVK